MHCTIKVGNLEMWGDLQTLGAFPIVDAPEPSEVIEKSEQEDASLAQTTFSIVEDSDACVCGSTPLTMTRPPSSVEEIVDSDEILIEEQSEVGGEDGEGEAPCIHEEEDSSVEENTDSNSPAFS